VRSSFFARPNSKSTNILKVALPRGCISKAQYLVHSTEGCATSRRVLTIQAKAFSAVRVATLSSQITLGRTCFCAGIVVRTLNNNGRLCGSNYSNDAPHAARHRSNGLIAGPAVARHLDFELKASSHQQFIEATS